MSTLTLILIVASVMLGVGVVAVLAWLLSTSYLNRVERRLARRKGLYRTLVSELAARERALLDPEIRRLATLLDLEALEAVLEEQARGTAERPGWLLDVYDRLGLVDKYAERLRRARTWRERAFAAELLGRVGNARAVPALLETIQATRTEDADVREIALRALARIADPRAVAPLLDTLRTADAWLAPRLADILTRHGDLAVDPLIAFLEEPGRHPARPWAANVLGEVKAPRAFPVLARGLTDPEDEVRAKCATALGRLGDRRAVNHLLENLLGDPAPFVRARIASSLGRFEDPAVIDRLVRALGDPAWWVRIRSVEALEQIGAHAEGPLLLALDDPDPEIRTRAAVALERLGVPAALAAMIQREEGAPQAVETLVTLAGSGPRELLAELLLHPAAKVRGAMVTAVQRSGRRDLSDEVARLAVTDPDPDVRVRSLETLGLLGAPVPAADLVRLLTDPDARTGERAAAARALGGAGDRSALPALAGAFAASGPDLRGAIVGAMSRLDATAVVALLDREIEPGDTAGKVAVLQALAQPGNRAAPAVLRRLARDSDPAVRSAVVAGWSRIGGPDAIGPVTEALDDRDETVRAAAAEGCGLLRLGHLGGAVLTLLETDPSPRVRERAALAAGLLEVPGGAPVLLAACRRVGPVAERAAAILALARYPGESLPGRVMEMVDGAAVREQLRLLLEGDPVFRLVAAGLAPSRRAEIRALAAGDAEEARGALADGMRSTPEAAERVRLVRGLRAYQGAGSRAALLQAARGDPDPEVRCAALAAVGDLLDPEALRAAVERALGDPSLPVRRAGVALSSRLPAERALAALVRLVRPDDDPALLAQVGGLAEAAFPAFATLALALPPDGDEALLVARVCRHVHHDGLGRLLPPLAESPSPEVREAVAALLRHRPALAPAGVIDALAADPVAATRRETAGAAAAADRWDLLERMTEDPEPEVRREVALAIAGARGIGARAQALLQRLAADSDMPVRAAAYVGRLLLGTPVPLPPALDPRSAAAALRAAGDLPALRETARHAPAEDRRLAAALALAIVQDEVAREVARTDPAPAIRHRVSGALDLTALPGTGAA